MPAFSAPQSTLINDVLRRQYVHVSDALRFQLTYDEFLCAFVPTDDREYYKRFAKEARLIYAPRDYPQETTTILSGATVKVLVHAGEGAPLIPRNISLQPDVNDALVSRLTSWVTNQLNDTSREFGRVRSVIDRLNMVCTTPAVMRYYWPAILMLIDDDADLKARYADLHDVQKPPRNGISFHPMLRKAMRQAAATLTTAAILKDAAPVRSDVSVYINPRNFGAQDDEFSAFTGM